MAMSAGARGTGGCGDHVACVSVGMRFDGTPTRPAERSSPMSPRDFQPRKGDPMADQTLHLTDATFDSELGKHKEVMMVDFWAEWCAPCRAIAPTLEELARESAGKVSLAKVNVDEHPALAARYGIRSIPTILLMKEGAVVDQVIGAVPKAQLKKKLDAIA